MAILYVGGQVAGRDGIASTTSVTFALTGGIDSVPRENDLVIITSVVGSQARNPAQAISGYTALGQLNPTATKYDTSLNVSYKFMGTTPDTTFTLPSTGNIADAQRYTVQVFRGVDATTPLDVAVVSATGTATSRPNPGSITPSSYGAFVVICGGGAAATGAAYTAPANFTTNFLTGFTADTNDALVGSGYWTGWTSGAVDPAAYTGGSNNANDSWAAYTIALRPQLFLLETAGTAPKGGGGISDFAAGYVATDGYIPGTAAPVVLTASAGSFTLTGSAATLARRKVLVAAAGTFSLTGAAATLARRKVLIAAAGSFTLTGASVVLAAQRNISASSGSFSLTGSAATLRRGLVLQAQAGVFSLTGAAADLAVLSGLTASSGSFVISGAAASLVVRRLPMVAAAGSFVMTGSSATFVARRVLTCDAGAYSFTGMDAVLAVVAANDGDWLVTARRRKRR